MSRIKFAEIGGRLRLRSEWLAERTQKAELVLMHQWVSLAASWFMSKSCGSRRTSVCFSLHTCRLLLPMEWLLIMMDPDISLSVQAMKAKLPSVDIGIILGSGLGAAAQKVADDQGIVVPYSDLPGMPQTQVVGHEGRLVLGAGAMEGVALLQGRVHSYEGHAVDRLTFATRLLAALGMKTLVVSNAAGGIQAGYSPGDLMLIDGHWTLCDVQERCCTDATLDASLDALPSVSPNAPPFIGGQSRFLWSSRLLQLASSLPSSLKIHQGCYAMMSGPNYETPAEIRMLRSLGCQAVGMSTIPEAIAAATRNIEVLGISCITNVAAGLSDQPLDHAEVSETAGSVETEFVDWLLRLVSQLKKSS